MATRRLYYDDSFIENFDARMLSCELAPPSAAAQAPVLAALEAQNRQRRCSGRGALIRHRTHDSRGYTL